MDIKFILPRSPIFDESLDNKNKKEEDLFDLDLEITTDFLQNIENLSAVRTWRICQSQQVSICGTCKNQGC